MKVVFSTGFKADLLEAETRYGAISERLSLEIHERVKEVVRTIIARNGGDHVGPHGFPCRACRPFPYAVCYLIEKDSLHVLGLVHDRRHPDFVKSRRQN
jgi:hypothetical protein